jgi:hypothetical protein
MLLGKARHSTPASARALPITPPRKADLLRSQTVIAATILQLNN